MATRRLFLCLCAVVPLLGACVIPASIMEALDEGAIPDVEPAANAYNQDLRWGRVRQAALQIVPEQREKFYDLFDEEQSTFHFTSVEILSAEPRTVDGTEVDVLVEWEYYSPPMLDERKVRQKQSWRYLVLEKRWEVEPDYAVFEAALAPHMRTRGAVPAAPAPAWEEP